jgi:hypothetical protein
MLKLNIDAAERFVAGYPSASWDGWTLELFKVNPRGWSRRDGAYRNGEWGILTRVAPDAQGVYKFRV